MKPRLKGKRWEINYRCPGYSKNISERFSTYEEANARIAEIKYAKAIGALRPPVKPPSKEKFIAKKFITLSEFLDEYVQLYGLNHWGLPTSPTTATALSIISSPISALCCSAT